jgi:hypothetical protein
MSGIETLLGVWSSSNHEKISETKGDGGWKVTEPVGCINEFNYWEPTDGQTEYYYVKLNICQADQTQPTINRVHLLMP